jgi:DhnA family fructose-bisphosphate aldolase class Ia
VFLCPRINRLFAADGKCFDLAIDHGLFEYVLVDGIEDMAYTVAVAIEASPDAIQLSPGQAHILQNAPGRHKPSLVLRVDTANVYAKRLPERLFAPRMRDAVGAALRWDAACVILNLFYMPDRPEIYNACVKNIWTVKGECERVGMPLMVDPLVMLPRGSGGYASDGDPEKVIPLTRQAAEIGADIIKCEPTPNSADFHKVVQAAGGRPVLPRGGSRTSVEAIFQRTWELMQEGASGIVYGRNVFQHPKPSAMACAFTAIVHDRANVKEAMEHLK